MTASQPLEDDMRFRSFRKIDTGQWVNVLFTVAGVEFSVPEQEHRGNIAIALGMPPDALETVDGDTDPRTGVLLEMPLPLRPAPTRTEELLSIPRSEWTAAQLRELLQFTAREIT